MANTTSETTRSEIPPVKKSIDVKAPREIAFRVFTTELATWWDLDNYHIGRVRPGAAFIEPRVGGRWFERGEDGSECDWGKVLVWEPPGRIVLAWQINSTWQFDPSIHSEVEVRFESIGDDVTRVVLEHHLLDTYGDAAAQVRGIFDSPKGWTHLVSAFASAAEGAAHP